MISIIDGRDSGKTRKLLRAAKEHDACVICKNPIKLQEKAYAYGIYGLDFISYTDLKPVDKKFVIDDIDEYLETINVIGFTLSIDTTQDTAIKKEASSYKQISFFDN